MLLVHALIERELRRTMRRRGRAELPFDPEERPQPDLTCEQVLGLLGPIHCSVLLDGDRSLETFHPELTARQRQVLEVLAVPESSDR